MSVLIIINGLPASGKTTLANDVSSLLSFPIYSKDSFKEVLFDSFSVDSIDGSKNIGQAAVEMLYTVGEENIKNGKSCILENYFYPDFTNPVMKNWEEKYKVNIIQIYCDAQGDVLFDRFKNRNRHKFHFDNDRMEEWKEIFFHNKREPLDISGPTFFYNTNKFCPVEKRKLYESITNFH